MTQNRLPTLTIGLLFPTAFLFLALSACQPEEARRDIRDFYFPLDRLEDGLVYQYAPQGADSLAPFYQYFRTVRDSGNRFLVGMQYNADLTPRQFTLEEELSNGMQLTKSRIYLPADSSRRQKFIPVLIQSGSLFPFSVKEDGGIFLYKVKWFEDPDSTIHNTVIRNRKYLGDTTAFRFRGKPLETISFSVRELIENYNEGYLEQEFTGEEWYARGLGLVRFRKEISPEFTMTYELVDTFAMGALEEEFRVQTEQERTR